ncbi:hypothetical protein Q8W71_17790 [Methylobacterium sp. NEAU 140]|uniref:alginate O-acetyltransferase AlgX-related protein n=1 Tax=Methylobacterium sp. NEAU 140 TaxID=3064945 RepID=UPI002736F1B8|nr:hypothetical protein [Methylobacterium sp. NEAU 140]MDP4024481.1 hypothetical protein [Methylobacterium sp. NEAU 140]
MMKASEEGVPNYIHVGKDGYLFIRSGSNNAQGLYEKTDLNKALHWQWRHHISERARKLRAMGVDYRHIIIPEKQTIYDHYLDGMSVDYKRSIARRCHAIDPYYENSPWRALNVIKYFDRRRRWNRILVDLVTPMRAERDRQQLFMRTDSHWSFAGRQIAYRAICRSLNVAPVEDLEGRREMHFDAYAGDLGSACTPPRCESAVIQIVERDSERVHANAIVAHRECLGTYQTLHLGSHVVWRNEKARDRRRVVLFGDSYSHFIPIMLSIMLAETFHELHFIWSTSVDWGYVERVKPDIVLTEMAERFMFRLPDANYDVEAYVRERFGDELRAAAS